MTLPWQQWRGEGSSSTKFPRRFAPCVDVSLHLAVHRDPTRYGWSNAMFSIERHLPQLFHRTLACLQRRGLSKTKYRPDDRPLLHRVVDKPVVLIVDARGAIAHKSREIVGEPIAGGAHHIPNDVGRGTAADQPPTRQVNPRGDRNCPLGRRQDRPRFRFATVPDRPITRVG